MNRKILIIVLIVMILGNIANLLDNTPSIIGAIIIDIIALVYILVKLK
jgi:hypothetical protein